MSLTHARRFRFHALVCLVFLGFGALFWKLVQLHAIDGPRLRAHAIEARREVTKHPSRRGEIRDRQGNLLAASDTVWDVGIDPQCVLPEDRGRAVAIAKLLSISPSKVVTAMSESSHWREPTTPDGVRREVRWIVLSKEVNETTKRAIEALRIKALYCEEKFRRTYPQGSLAAHVVGYINQDGDAVSGVEKSFHDLLHGQDGWIESERDGRRREVVARRLRDVPAVNGQTIELTIDSVIQSFCEQELSEVVAAYQPKGAVVIVSEPRTGKILALACSPTFDLNRYSDRKASPLDSQRNRALADLYEPGSVFKIVTIAGALQAGIITRRSVFNCASDVVPYRGRMVSMPADSHHMGSAEISRIVTESSNRGTVQVGMRYAELLGEARYFELIHAFGFGDETGIACNGGEVRGLLSPVSRWDGLTISRLPMGHSISVTPIQMHMAMSAIAADGLLMRPLIVGRVLNPDGSVSVEYGPRIHSRAVSAGAAHELADLLRAVCSKEGTAPDAAIPGYDVAGKTGTTQKLVDGRYSTTKHVASFSGFFPASNPRIAITVVVDEPNMPGVAYGGKVSAPIFRRIAERCIKRLEIPPVSTAPGRSFAER
jgi:cell division protein FtsI/penicillin-binding protein 2